MAQKKPAESLLTSFSVLMAAHKGDIHYFVESAPAIDRLTEQSRVLIAEACTHAPLAEDIGREKIPRMLPPMPRWPRTSGAKKFPACCDSAWDKD